MNTHVDHESLLSSSVRDLRSDPAVTAHVANCESCREQLDVFVAAEAVLRASLTAVTPDTAAVAITAAVLRRTEARVFWMRATLASLTVLFAFLVSPWGQRSQVALGRWAETAPPRLTETYALRCLQPAQAAALVMARLESEGSDVRTAGEPVAVVVITATAAEHVIAGRLLARLDQPRSRLCASR